MQATAWSPLVLLAVLAALALAAACLDAVLAARAAGSPAAPAVVAPLRDGARLLVAQRRTTLAPDALLWRAGGGGLLVAAALATAVVPFGDRVVQDTGVGVVWFNAFDVLIWGLVWLTGWGPNSVLALAGGYRFLALALSYELPLMFALTSPAIAAGSLRVGDVVGAQSGLWFVVQMPVAFAVYLLAVFGFSLSGPFAQPVAADLGGGVAAELGGVDRLLFQAGRYALLAAGAAFAVPLFLGGDHGPLLPGWLWSVVKTVAVLAALVALRRRVPLLRGERFTPVGWVVLLPAAVAQALLTSVIAVARA